MRERDDLLVRGRAARSRSRRCWIARAIGFGLRRPVGPAAEMRHRRQHVERVATRRRQRRVGRGGAMEIEAEIVGQHLAFEDVASAARGSAARARWCGAGRRRICALGAEIPDEQAHRVARALDPPVGPAPARVVPAAGGDRSRRESALETTISARDRLAGRQPHAGRAAVRDLDLAHLRARSACVPPCPSISPTRPSHQRARAAHREVDAPAPLEEARSGSRSTVAGEADCRRSAADGS